MPKTSKPDRLSLLEWQRQQTLPIITSTHIADELFCAGTGLDIRAARRLQADQAFRSTEASYAGGSVRIWPWDSVFKAATCEAMHEHFALTYPQTAEIVKGIPETLWSLMLPSEADRAALPGEHEKSGGILSAEPADWFMVLAGRRVLLIAGRGIDRAGLTPLRHEENGRPVALIGELTPEGYRSRIGEAAYPRSAAPNDFNRANADLAELRFDSSPAVVRVNVSLIWRRCALKAAGLTPQEF